MPIKFDDTVFVTRRAQVIFCLLNNDKGDLNKALGITHHNFLDGAVAAQWKADMLDALGVQEDNELASDNLIEARRRVLLAYKRMIGLA